MQKVKYLIQTYDPIREKYDAVINRSANNSLQKNIHQQFVSSFVCSLIVLTFA